MALRVVSTTLLILIGSAAGALAAGGERPGDAGGEPAGPRYERGVALVEAGEFAEARKVFEQAAGARPRDPDVLNMLAYTQRRTGDIDEAIRNYKRALKLRPSFPQAREYLGEAYLQASLRELEVLRGQGDAAAEETAQLIAALRTAVAALGDARPAGPKGRW